MDTNPLIQIDHVSRVIETHGRKTSILDDVICTVPVQSLFSIIGPSGSGKSTLLNMLTGIDRPTSGRIVFGGEELRAMSENALARWRGKHIGIIFQFFQLLPTLTAVENVLLALELGGSGNLPRRAWRERALACLDMARVKHLAERLPGATGYMEASALQQIAGSPVSSPGKAQSGPVLATVLMVKVRDTQQAMASFQAIEQALTQAQIKVTDASLQDTTSGLLAINGMLVVIRVLSLIALLLTGMLIINTMTVLITEQVSIIGTMKALGGTRQVIIRGYLISVGIYSLVGTILGLEAGIGAGTQLAALFAGFLHIDLGPIQGETWILVVSILVGLLLPPLAALAPLWQGTRITVREALAADGVTAGSGNQRAWGQRLAWVPQTIWLGMRGIFRKRTRAILTVLALTLSCAVFLSVQITTSSIGYTLDQQKNAFNCDVTAQLCVHPDCNYEKCCATSEK